MSIRIALCRVFLFFSFLFFCFWFWSVLFCWAVRVGGMGGFGRLEGREVGKLKLYTIGKMGGGVAIWRKRERSNGKQIKTHKKNT